MRLDHNMLNVMVFLFRIGRNEMSIHACKMSVSFIGQKNFQKNYNAVN